MKEPWDHLDEANLDAWRDGALDPADAARVEAHLAECSRCAGLLADLEAFEETVGRGYRAAESVGREPDWAAQRAAIVARTSGRRRGARGLWRWAPQAAVVAVAVVAVVVVVERGVRGPGEAQRAVEAPAAGASRPEAFEAGAPAPDENREESPAPERKPAPAAPAPAPRTPSAGAAGAAADQAAPPEEAARVETLQKAATGPVPPVERFRRDARVALAAEDTTAARRALGFLRDSVDAAGLDEADRATARALADSLAELLARTP